MIMLEALAEVGPFLLLLIAFGIISLGFIMRP